MGSNQPETAPVSETSSASSFATNNTSLLQQKKQQQQAAFLREQQMMQQQQQMMQHEFQNNYDQQGSHQNQLAQHQQQQMSLHDMQHQRAPMNGGQTQESVQYCAQEVQNQIQQVQNEIQQFQLGGQNSMQQPQHQQGFQSMQRMGNTAGLGATRSPPGRSTSMPIKSSMRGSPMAPNLQFVQQQQMQHMQQQAQMKAMNNSFHGSGNFNQQMDGSLHSCQSVPGSMNMNQGMQMMQQQNMEPGTMGPGFGSNGSVRQNSLPRSPTNGVIPMVHPSMAHPGELLTTGSFGPTNTNGAQGFPPVLQGGSGQQKSPATVNDAMEKLCESMRRSAMSRSLVKQLNGRNLSRNNSASARGLTKQNSGRSIARHNSGVSGKTLVRANSGRSIQRSASGRAGLLPKHRIQRDALSSSLHSQGPPGRGVFRHKSASQAGGAQPGSPQMMLQIDDNPVGMF